MRKVIVTLGLLAAILCIAAAPEVLRVPFLDSGTYLSRVAGNAAAASRTVTLDVRRVSKLSCVVTYQKLGGSSASAVTIQSYYKPYYDSSSWGLGQSMSISSGTGTMSDYTWSKTISTSQTSFAVDVPVMPWAQTKLIVTATSGGASDLIWLYCVGGAGL